MNSTTDDDARSMGNCLKHGDYNGRELRCPFRQRYLSRNQTLVRRHAMYTGTMINDLLDLVQTQDLANDALCLCRFPLGQHSHEGHFCPSRLSKGELFRQTKFRALGCQACVANGSWDPGQECGRETVVG